MALNADTLKTLIIGELTSNTFLQDGTHQTPYITLLAEGIAKAVVKHIATDAVVTTTSGAPDGEHSGIIS